MTVTTVPTTTSRVLATVPLTTATIASLKPIQTRSGLDAVLVLGALALCGLIFLFRKDRD
jgi:hypothetical protein